VLLQNNSEIRPAGGFISSYANLSFYFGVPRISLHDSYSVPPPENEEEPPYPLNEILEKDIFYKGFVFRDANFSPDFFESAKEVKRLYGLSYPEKRIDGIFAFEMEFFVRLLEKYGTLFIEEQEITPVNMFHFFQVASKNIDLHNEESLGERKDVSKRVFVSLLKNIIFSPTKYAEFTRFLRKECENRGLVFAFFEAKLQDQVRKQGWSGELSPVISDYIHINRANIGGRKADRFILPQYSYEIRFDEKRRGTAKLKADFMYSASQGLYSDFYQAYIRFFLPSDVTEIQKLGNARFPFTEERYQDKLSLGTVIHIWPGETQSLSLEYALPERITPENYSLHIDPMLGNFGEFFTVRVVNAYTDEFFLSEEFTVRDHTAFFSGNIETPQTFSLSLQEDTSPPVIIWQTFLHKNRIELLFSERLSENSLHTENFVLKKDEENIPIQSVSQDETFRVFLDIKNTSEVFFEDHYTLSLKNIFDVFGNSIKPEEKDITLVFRVRE
jgi:hypothetical protein